jgi:hypothetical protein
MRPSLKISSSLWLSLKGLPWGAVPGFEPDAAIHWPVTTDLRRAVKSHAVPLRATLHPSVELTLIWKLLFVVFYYFRSRSRSKSEKHRKSRKDKKVSQIFFLWFVNVPFSCLSYKTLWFYLFKWYGPQILSSHRQIGLIFWRVWPQILSSHR